MTVLRLLPAFLILLQRVAISQGLSTSINSDDWGLSDPADVRLARISLTDSPSGPQINVQAVYETGYFSSSVLHDRRNGCVEVASFDDPSINKLGGSYSVFQSGSSTAILRRNLNPFGENILALTYSKGNDGYCGMWMHTFNSAAPPEERRFFDGTMYTFLMVTLRGRSGNEQLLVKIADEEWNRKEDAYPIGEIRNFLPRGRIDTVWQTALIPQQAFPRGLDMTRMASIVFEAVGSGNGTVEISSVYFCNGVAPPVVVSGNRTAKPGDSLERALWVWNTKSIMGNNGEIALLRQFAKERNINHVFLALPYDPTLSPEPGVSINREPMATLVRQLNASNLKVHALIGDKDFVKPEARTFVRNTIKSIISYQKSVDPAAQFYGLHLDIEPYLLPGFGSKRQPWFLENLLEAFAECATLARESRLVVGADIPPWFDSPNDLTHIPMVIQWRGSTKPVYQHIMDLMDFVVLMDYRTAAGEIITQAVTELRYGVQTGKRVFVGLETVPLVDETLFTVRGRPQRGLPKNGTAATVCFLQLEKEIRIALLTEDQSSAAAEFVRKAGRRPEDLFWWNVSNSSRASATRVTFAGQGGESRMSKEMTEVEVSLRAFQSFSGFAIHDYEGMKSLLGK